MRTLALFIGILSAFRLVKPLENLIGTIHQISAPSIWLTVTTIAVTAFFSAVAGVGLLFYFALYRDKGTLHVSRRLRFLGRGTALVLGITLAADLPKASLWNAMQSPSNIGSITNIVNILLTALSIALLIALSREPSSEPSKEIAVGRLLRVASEINAKAIGLVLSFSVFRLLAPQTYSPTHDLSVPQFLTLLLQFCGLVTPLIVYKGSRDEEQADEIATDEGPVNVEEAPEQN